VISPLSSDLEGALYKFSLNDWLHSCIPGVLFIFNWLMSPRNHSCRKFRINFVLLHFRDGQVMAVGSLCTSTFSFPIYFKSSFHHCRTRASPSNIITVCDYRSLGLLQLWARIALYISTSVFCIHFLHSLYPESVFYLNSSTVRSNCNFSAWTFRLSFLIYSAEIFAISV